MFSGTWVLVRTVSLRLKRSKEAMHASGSSGVEL